MTTVEIKNREGYVIQKKEYQTKAEAETYVEDAIDDDLEAGEYENYDYYIDGECVS